MKNTRKGSSNIMRKYYQLLLMIVCFVSVITLLIYRHEYYRLRYVLEVLNIFGKPGLSTVEFCGPGFNATMLSEIVRNSSMEVKETPPLFQQIDDNFYSYSSFLRSFEKYDKLTKSPAHIIDTIVIGKASESPNFRCNIWLENTMKPKAGKFSYKMIPETVKDFQLYIFQCTLAQNLGKPIGISFYLNDYNIDPIHAPISKLIQVHTKRRPKERTNIQFINNMDPVLCVIPNQVPIVSRDAFIDFLVFHNMMGVRNFMIYDSMISEDIIRRLNLLPEYAAHWQIQFFPLNYPFVFAKSYDIIRKAIELDCVFRHFRMDKEEVNKVSHTVALSWDEFLVPRVHNNLKEVLNDFDPTRKVRSIELKQLLFCLNQPDDDNTELGHPNIMRKTHYFNLPTSTSPIYIRNLESMTTYEDIYDLKSTVKTLPIGMLGVHKYTECRDPKGHNPTGLVYNETQMQMFQHKFEGAMLKFDQSLVSNTVYRLYRSGQIWEKPTSESVRDIL